jgi:hypothetical protein
VAIINNTFGFVFIHVPKAAGTSVTNTFSAYTNYCDLEIGGTAFGEKLQPLYRNKFGLYKHIPANELKAVLGTKDWSRFFTFSIVRHPADRLLSTFNFLRQWGGTPEDLKEKLSSFEDFDSFVRSEVWKRRPGPDNIFFPQTHWLCDKNNNLLVNFVGKLENLDSSIDDIKELLSLPYRNNGEIKKLNESSGEKSYSALSSESAQLINSFYERDFTTFQYEMLGQD